MEEPKKEEVKQRVKRVFINNIDSYSSKYIAKFLFERGVGEPVQPDGGAVEEERMVSEAFQIVGSVSHQSDEARANVLEEYLDLTRDELLPKLMECDVIIFNISQHTDQVDTALWALSALHDEIRTFSGPKMFILISTVMTWACSKPLDPNDLQLPFTDEIFWRRSAHPNFRQHIDLEKKVVKMGKTDKTMFTTYVVASGLQYGMGEQVFHLFFKTAWLGREHEIPVFGDGKNIVPMIHINDLASVIQHVIKHQPEPNYLLAVDSSKNTMEDIVKTIASVLGPGKIKKKSFEEAFLSQELSMMEIDCLLVNLRMEGVYLKKMLSINWWRESGLVDNIELVVEEYRRIRGLLPISLCILGPPAVGKSTLSNLICKHYKLHHITLKETISETLTQLENAGKNSDTDRLSNNSATEVQTQLNSLKDSTVQNGGHLDDHLVVKAVKNKMMSKPCRNQGFVLDGFPETYEQAKELFSVEEHESEDGTFQISLKKKMPEFVLYLEASDDFLKDRVMTMPEKHRYDLEHFLQQLAKYRENRREDKTVVNYFDEREIHPLYQEITSSEQPDCQQLMQIICDTVGKPRTCGPIIQEVEEEKRKAEEKKFQERAQEEQKGVEEARQRAVWQGEWTMRLEQVKQEEHELLEARAVPMKNYLLEHVMCTLTQGLIECCMAQPQDPVDFLAEYLFKRKTL